MSEYTEKPWEIWGEIKNYTNVVHIRPKGTIQTLACVHRDVDGLEKLKARSQLIAAAPELLEVAKSAHERLLKIQELLAEEGYVSFEVGMDFEETLELKKAIQKAEGDNS